MEVKESICGFEPRPAKMGLTILCDSSSIRLVSSGMYDNLVTVSVREAVEEDMNFETNMLMVCPNFDWTHCKFQNICKRKKILSAETNLEFVKEENKGTLEKTKSLLNTIYCITSKDLIFLMNLKVFLWRITNSLQRLTFFVGYMILIEHTVYFKFQWYIKIVAHVLITKIHKSNFLSLSFSHNFEIAKKALVWTCLKIFSPFKVMAFSLYQKYLRYFFLGPTCLHFVICSFFYGFFSGKNSVLQNSGKNSVLQKFGFSKMIEISLIHVLNILSFSRILMKF